MADSHFQSGTEDHEVDEMERIAFGEGATPRDAVKLQKKDLDKLISVNSQRVRFFDNPATSLKSEVWKSFQLIQVDNKNLDFAGCRNCKQIYSYSKQLGTTSLSRHTCSGAAGGSKPVGKYKLPDLHNQPRLPLFAKKLIPSHAVETLNNEIILGLAKDLRPLGTVEGKGFERIAQALVNFGANHGVQDIKSIIRHRTALKSTYLPKLVKDKQDTLKKELLTAPSNKYSFTMDMWSDKYQQRTFLSFTIHFINKEWELKCHMLAVEEFDEKKTTDNVRQECKRILSSYFDQNVQEIMDNSIAVTDGGSNMINVFQNRFPCYCHRLNLVVQWTMNPARAPEEDVIEDRARRGIPINPKKLFHFASECPVYKQSIDGTKKLVAYFKKAGLNKKLTISLKQDMPTRWNSELIMMQSYLKSAVEVKRILFDQNQLSRLSSINDGAIAELVQFFTPFKEASDKFSGSNYPTIHLVAPWFHKLMTHVEFAETDCYEMQKMKSQARICLEEYCKPDVFYYVACFLHPRYRKLKFATHGVREAVLQILQNRIKATAQSSVNATTTEPSAPTPPMKKSKLADFEDSSDDEVDSQERNEINAYMSMKLSKALGDEDLNILEFWRSATSLPGMQCIAREILGTPASQASDERVFSSTGLTLAPRRTRLGGETLSMLTFLHKNCSF